MSFRALRDQIDSWISGSGPTDPLYLSNRSFLRKARPVLLVGALVLLLAGLSGVILRNSLSPASSHSASAGVQAAPGEGTSRVLPDLEKTYQSARSAADSDCQVTEARIGPGRDHTLYVKVRNNGEHFIREADLVFDLVDSEGSRVGALPVRIENIAPHAEGAIQSHVAETTARLALVRDVQTR